MNRIKIKNDIYVSIDHFDWQTSPSGEKFRLTSLKKNLQIPAKWIGDSFKYHWIYTFIYESGRTFEIEIDYNDKFLSLTKK